MKRSRHYFHGEPEGSHYDLQEVVQAFRPARTGGPEGPHYSVRG